MDAENIQIDKLSVARQRTDTADDLLITIVLSNPSASAIVYVLDKLRNIDYDRSTHVLSIGLFEKEPAVNRKISHPFIPNQVLIQPKSNIELTFKIPIKVTRYSLSPDEPFGQKREVLDISTVEKVKCTVAFSTQVFQVPEKAKGEQLLGELSRWGQTVTRTFDVKL